MIILFSLSVFVANALTTVSGSDITCTRVINEPTLDGDLSDWEDVEGATLALTGANGALPYAGGDASIKCTYDNNNIYFAFEVPGKYRFNTTDNHLCASISTMWKVGQLADYVNMGGCPVTLGGTYGSKCDGVPENCYPYRVDLGAHWELKTTEMGVLYEGNRTSGTGNDPIANNDDEYAVTPYCRPDDDDANAADDWSGAWLHTSPDSSDGGSYVFEMRRPLTTESVISDVQLYAGETYDFGFAYWDPYENEETGWSKAGHYVTGQSKDWISLTLEEPEEAKEISCSRVFTEPTLDGDLSDWEDVEGAVIMLTGANGGLPYPGGYSSIKCTYDNNNIYFAFEVPGKYRFNTTDNHLCASISTMWKVGQLAATGTWEDALSLLVVHMVQNVMACPKRETYDFGFAYWDPYENEETGWSKAGHYVTGQSQDWISLTLEESEEAPITAEPNTEPTAEPTAKPNTSAASVILVPFISAWLLFGVTSVAVALF
eukprot:CAMPEP_0194262582 /NCGR_PEP_ID=MMETSP0158-20130606/46612_1 /TAXON_ID=33649 /ORGANISM="Thalassionema nitzschioides, Strain L26-B" /LENGTH=488 /DNA_ID=CAMNT_0039002741 /DNA_START=98 /DNA_END=1565 /DNA_ORIENTATION=+